MALTRLRTGGIAANAVVASSIAPGAVEITDIADNAVSSVKILGTISPEKGGTGLSSVGLTGNVLTSNGTAFVSQTLTVANGDVTTIVFSTVGNVTYTKPANLQKIKVTVIGGGGDAFRDAPGTGIGGAGGGGGGAIKFIPAPTIPGPVTVTVGRGGIGGGGGNTSSFGAFVSATGGSAGLSAPFRQGVGGFGTNGDINLQGGGGKYAPPSTSHGGDAALGFGIGGENNGPGIRFGGGGGGRYVPVPTPVGTQFSLGANGVVVVEEFF